MKPVSFIVLAIATAIIGLCAQQLERFDFYVLGAAYIVALACASALFGTDLFGGDMPASPMSSGWAILHADGKRWRTMDTIGMPAWTDDPAKALICRRREHVDAYAADDPDDVRIVQVAW